MHLCSRLAAIAYLVSLAVAQDSTCHDYAILNARGTSQPQGPDQGTRGMVNMTLSALPGGVSYNVVYPASYDFQKAIDGANDIVRYINAGLAACPSQKYAVLGYSQGALASSFGLNLLKDTPAYRQIVAVLDIGNPGRVPGKAANIDQNGGDAQRNNEGLFTLDGQGQIPDRFYIDNKVLDICYVGDWICAKGTGEGVDAPHALYGTNQKVQKLGSDFLIAKLTGSSSSTPPASNDTTSTCTTSSSQATPYPTGNATLPVYPTGTSVLPTGTGGASPTSSPSAPVSTIVPSPGSATSTSAIARNVANIAVAMLAIHLALAL